MRIAIVSDVHANREALSAVLHDLSALQVGRVLCLGDIVGYNADPAGCIDLLVRAGALCIAGNHELAVLGRISTAGFALPAARAVAWTRARLGADHLDWLATLPTEAAIGGVVAVHGALTPGGGCATTRLEDAAQRADCFAALAAHRTGARICAFGHTHRPGIFELGFGERLLQDEVHLLAEKLYLLNPGTVGQPRSGDARATYMIFDSVLRSVSVRRVEYDAAAARAKLRAAGLAPRASRAPRALRSAAWAGLRAIGLESALREARARRQVMAYSTPPYGGARRPAATEGAP